MRGNIAHGPHLPQRRLRGTVADWRLGVALCASALAHAWLFAVHPASTSGRLTVPLWSTLSARITIAPPQSPERWLPDPGVEAGTLTTVEERAADAVRAVRTPPAGTAAPVGAARPSLTRRVEHGSTTLASTGPPSVGDTTWYTAQDIDTYPQAAAPLRLALPGDTAAATQRLLFWLRIDEQGEVIEVSAGQPGIPAGWLDAARASLAATRFTPARKDGRAVRSRLLLGVSFSAEESPQAASGI